jgi:uncharacterized membrane protein YgdD (TMEM256/DUF423 family)
MWILCGAILNSLGVILGAFGAHFLKTRISMEEIIIFETAVKYMFIHAAGLIFIGLLSFKITHLGIQIAGWLFLLGILIFSGSLFLLIITKSRLWGAITPLGGLSFIIGWLLIAYASTKLV